MKKSVIQLLVLLFTFLFASVCVYAENKSTTDPAPGGDSSDNDDFDGDNDGEENGGDNGKNCSVVYDLTIGKFQSEFGQEEVHLKIKRLKPTPLLFTPQSLHFDSIVASSVFDFVESREAQARDEASAELAIATASLDEANETVTETEAEKNTAQVILQQAESDLAVAQAALATEPTDPALQLAVSEATLARNTAQSAYDTAVGAYDAAVAAVPVAAQAVSVADLAYQQAQQAYDYSVLVQESEGSLIRNADGIAASLLRIVRPDGTFVKYEAPSVSVSFGSSVTTPLFAGGGASFSIIPKWQPTGQNIHFGSRLESRGDYKFARIDGKGSEYIFETLEGSDTVFKTPSGRRFSVDGLGVRQEVIKESGVLRQVLTPQTLADIVIVDEYSYEIRLYDPVGLGDKNADGLYVPSGSPHGVVTIENPERNPNILNHVKITTAKGTNVRSREWIYSESAGAWSLIKGVGYEQVSINKTITEEILPVGEVVAFAGGFTVAGGATTQTKVNEIYEWEVVNADNEIVERRQEIVGEFRWGKRTTKEIMDPGGADLTTAYTYYTNENEEHRYGKEKVVRHPDGSWEFKDYDEDERIILSVEPWLSSSDTTPSLGVATYYDYEPVDPSDTPLSYDVRPRTETVKTLGKITSKTFHAYYTNEDGEYVEVEEQAATSSSLYGDAGNLRHIKTYYPSDESQPEPTSGRLKTEVFADGTMDAYTYERLADYSFVTTVTCYNSYAWHR